MLTRSEAASRLRIHEAALIRWVEYGLVTRYAHNDYAFLISTRSRKLSL